MPTLISAPARITSAGNKPKLIDECADHVNTGTDQARVAHRRSPSGWVEAGQQPEFDEITVVLRGSPRVEHRDGPLDVEAGQAVVTKNGEWVRHSTPQADGAEYIAVCLPAVSPATVDCDPE